MNKLSVELNNCYGIGSLEKEFDFTESNTFLIYAPNGTMKTSFAKTMSYLSGASDEVPSDKIYTSRNATFTVKGDNDDLSPKDILVVDPEDERYDASDKISTFVASKELKKKYDEIYIEIEKRKNEYIKKLKSVSQSSDCETELTEVFSDSDKDIFLDALVKAAGEIEEVEDTYVFKYNDVFDKKKNVRKFLEQNKDDIEKYISTYNDLLQDSNFFSASENSFGTYQANTITKSIEDNSFFDAGHSFQLQGDVPITSADELKTLVIEEIGKIVNDSELKSIFDRVDKAIGSNAELRAFKNVIEKNNSLLLELRDYEGFRRKVWAGYLKQLQEESENLCSYFVEQKKALEVIFEEAKKEISIWKELVETFNSRFYVPFKVSILNQEDVILKETGAALSFHYSDRNEEAIEKDGKSLSLTLSKGEQRALYILNLLFDFESRRSNENSTLVILDDIADSFDYKNKYAIIEYVKDLHESNQFKMLILTHNFDFYRTVASRLSLNREHAVLMASKDDNCVISLTKGQYVNDVFDYFLGRVNEKKVFISVIPFLRNISSYTEGKNSASYKLLTQCLHIKAGSEDIVANDISSLLRSKYNKCRTETIEFGDEKLIELIEACADDIADESRTDIDEVLLENKIVLSIAIRLLAENFMMDKMANLKADIYRRNQTIEMFKDFKGGEHATKERIRVLDKVVLMTPENIHLNAFMYEPLIDISVWYLIRLYGELKELT